MARVLSTVLLLACVHLCLSAKVPSKTSGASQAVPRASSGPHFCKGLECPTFTTVHTTEEYEERQYDLSHWVSTEVMGMNYEAAVSEGFDRLFNYIDGHNANKQKIAMTAPVATRVIPGQGPACETNFTVSFFIPAEHQANPPAPSDDKVFFSQIPAHRSYVKSFGGFASQDDWINAAAELANTLNDPSLYDGSYYYTAGYDSPFTFFNRHNEVWFVAN